MRHLVVFNHITLDGYFVGPDGDIDFLYQRFKNEEFHSFAVENYKPPALSCSAVSLTKSWSATGPLRPPSKANPQSPSA